MAKNYNFGQILAFWGAPVLTPFTDEGQIWWLEQTQGLHLQAKFHLNVFIASFSGAKKTQFRANFDILGGGGSCTDPLLSMRVKFGVPEQTQGLH